MTRSLKSHIRSFITCFSMIFSKFYLVGYHRISVTFNEHWYGIFNVDLAEFSSKMPEFLWTSLLTLLISSIVWSDSSFLCKRYALHCLGTSSRTTDI